MRWARSRSAQTRSRNVDQAGTSIVVEAQDLVAGAQAGAVQVRVLAARCDDVQVGELDAGALEQARALRQRRERDDARLEHGHVGQTAERVRRPRSGAGR